MAPQLVVLLLQGGAVAILGIAAATDVKVRIIPNRLVICICVIGSLLRLLDGGWSVLLSMVIAMVVLLALVALAKRSHIGGGDAKMIAASVLLVPPAQVPALLVAIACAGGGLAAIFWFSAHVGQRAAPVPAAIADDTAGLPYGVAILAGVAFTLMVQP